MNCKLHTTHTFIHNYGINKLLIDLYATCLCGCFKHLLFSSLVFSGLFQSSTFGFAGILPQQYTAAVMGGQVNHL